jgi:hypothetical protein
LRYQFARGYTITMLTLDELIKKAKELEELINQLPPIKAAMIAKDRLTESVLWAKEALSQ